MVATASALPSNAFSASMASSTTDVSGTAMNSVVMRPAAVCSLNSSSCVTSCRSSGPLGRHFRVDRFEDGLALGRRKILDDVGDVGRVKLRETFVGDLELDPAGR